MTDITAVGEILIDLTQSGVNELGIPVFAANPGGAPANLAVAAARLGASTAFIGKVGTDSYGTFLRNTLIDNQVDVSGMVTDPRNRTTLAVVAVDKQGERTFSFYRDPSADVNLKAEEISDAQLKNTKFLHFGSVSLTTDPARSATLHSHYRAQRWFPECNKGFFAHTCHRIAKTYCNSSFSFSCRGRINSSNQNKLSVFVFLCFFYSLSRKLCLIFTIKLQIVFFYSCFCCNVTYMKHFCLLCNFNIS